jgi:ribonuclease T2
MVMEVDLIEGIAMNRRLRPTKSATLPVCLSVVALVLAVFVQPAHAQRGGNEPGKFDYYALSLSWSPTYCAGQPSAGNDPQCSARGRPYAFVLHGVWPQFERGWPQDCASPDRGFVPRAVANRMLDIMPSDKLVFHEYRKHGTCSGLGVDGYFDMARGLYNKVKIPQRYAAITDPRTFVSTPEVLADFLAANPGMKADGIVVTCGGPGPRLQEIRICFDKGGNFRSCGRNENQSRLCSSARVYMPPVRQGGVRPSPALGQRI